MYSEQFQRELIERLRKRAECFDHDARPDIATDYEMAAALIEDLKEKYDNSRESTKWLMAQNAKVVRCKDCRFWHNDGIITTCDRLFGSGYEANWFCANAERKENGNA